ncbi:MAG: hypothetical protein ACP5UV_06690, partial [Thermoplasmata archaeon]
MTMVFGFIKFLPQYVISTLIALIVLDYMLKHDPSIPFFHLKNANIKKDFSYFNSRMEFSSIITDLNLHSHIYSNKFVSSIEKGKELPPMISLIPERPLTAFKKQFIPDGGIYIFLSILFAVSLWFTVFLFLTPYRSIASVLPKWNSNINYILIIIMGIGLLEASISYIFFQKKERLVLYYIIIAVLIIVNAVTFLPSFSWIVFLDIRIRILYQIIISFLTVTIAYLIYELGNKNT